MSTDLFSFVLVGVVVADVISALHLLEEFFHVRVVLLLVMQEQVGPPFKRVKTPMTGSVFLGVMSVSNEFLRTEQSMALGALDTLRNWVYVQVGGVHTGALPETLVVHFQRERQFNIRSVDQLRWIAVQEHGAQALGVALGDQAAAGHAERQYPGTLQVVQLHRVAGGQENTQVVAHDVNLVLAESRQDQVQDLRKT